MGKFVVRNLKFAICVNFVLKLMKATKNVQEIESFLFSVSDWGEKSSAAGTIKKKKYVANQLLDEFRLKAQYEDQHIIWQQ